MHEAVFFHADAHLLDSTAQWLHREFAVSGKNIVIIATEPHRLGLASRLSVYDREYALAVRDGRCRMLDAAETLSRFMRDGEPDPALFHEVIEQALASAGVGKGRGPSARAAIYGEMVGVLCSQGKSDAAVRLEELWNDSIRDFAISLRCGYSLSDLHDGKSQAAIARICEQHTDIILAEKFGPEIKRDHERLIAYLDNRLNAR